MSSEHQNTYIDDSVEFLSCDASINDFTDRVNWVLITQFKSLCRLEPSVCPLNNDQIVVIGGHRRQEIYGSMEVLDMPTGQVEEVLSKKTSKVKSKISSREARGQSYSLRSKGLIIDLVKVGLNLKPTLISYTQGTKELTIVKQ